MSNKRILIVDDQDELRKLIRMTLELEEHELHEATNGQQALDMVSEIQPDIVIMDVMMPGGVDGYEACRQIKDSLETRDIFVILLTARGQQADIDQGLAAGANTYLVKPFSPLELISQVEKGLC